MILWFFFKQPASLTVKTRYKIMLFYLRTTLFNHKSSQRASQDRLSALIIPIYYNISASKIIKI